MAIFVAHVEILICVRSCARFGMMRRADEQPRVSQICARFFSVTYYALFFLFLVACAANVLTSCCETQDAVALLRLDDLYVDSFQVQDVKTLTGDHLRFVLDLLFSFSCSLTHVDHAIVAEFLFAPFIFSKIAVTFVSCVRTVK